MTAMRLTGSAKAFASVNCSPTSATARDGSQKTFGPSNSFFACAGAATGRRLSASVAVNVRENREASFEFRLSEVYGRDSALTPARAARSSIPGGVVRQTFAMLAGASGVV